MRPLLVAIDLDGTLIDLSLRIPPSAAAAVQKLSDNAIAAVIATGRSALLIPPCVRSLPTVRYLITCNGARLVDCLENRELYRKSLSPQAVCAVQETLLPFSPGLCRLGAEHIVINESYTSLFAQFAAMPDIEAYFRSLPLSASLPEGEAVDKINVLLPPEQLLQARAVLKKISGITVVSSSRFVLEIMAEGVSKASGLLFLCKHCGITPLQCAAVGDSENDLALFRCAGVSVAMGNAQPAVKAAASFVSTDLEQEGFANAVEYLLSLDA